MHSIPQVPATLFSFNFSYWILQTVAMMITALLIPRLRISGPLGAFVTVVALAFVNSKVWDAALFFQIPDTFSSQVLCLFLSNGLIFWVLIKILPGIEVDGFLPALIAPVVFSLSSILISQYAKDIDWIKVFEWSLRQLEGLRTNFQGNVVTNSLNVPGR